MSKFKVGDKVRIESKIPLDKYYELAGGWTPAMEDFLNKEYLISEVDESYYLTGYHLKTITDKSDGNEYLWDERLLVPADEYKSLFTIYQKDYKTIIAKSTETGITASARCHPQDTFSIEDGACLAMLRLRDKTKQKKEYGFYVGEEVKVIERGQTYDCFIEFVEKNTPDLISKFERCRLPGYTVKYTVKYVGYHPTARKCRLAIILSGKGEVFVIQVEGLKEWN